jgi:hypothetical protein
MSVATRIAAALLAGALASGTAAAASRDELGNVSFANSCGAAVQGALQRAVALLHSFWWSEGEKAFEDVLARDPHCAVAAWGIATIMIGNPFGAGASPAAAKKAEEAIAQGRTLRTGSEREKGYVEAIAAYYDRYAERPHGARLRSLADAFESLARQYPDDDETQIFAALYLAATQPPNDKSFARALRAAAMLEPQFQKHPNHPGVVHYLIHAYDFPPLAEKGLPAAMRYAEIAPAPPHAQHMPSHIFTRVGLWQESIDANRRSVAAARASGEITDQLHAYDYMVYADLQLAHDGDARAILDEIRNLAENNRAADYARAVIPARYAVERGQWAEAKKLPEPEQSQFRYTGAMRYFARALGAARNGDAAAAASDLQRLRDIEESLKAAKDTYWASEVGVQRLGAEAWIAFAEGERDAALELMRQAAEREDASEKSAVSPGRLIPARELPGDMLFAAGQPTAALAEYEASQLRDPRRFRSFWGAAQAADQAGYRDKARFYYARLVEMAGSGDARPELAAARAYLAAK